MDQKTDRPFSPALTFPPHSPPPLGHTHIRRARGKTFTGRVVGVNKISRTIEWEGDCVSCGAAVRQTTPFSSTKGLTRMNCDDCYRRMIENGTLRGLMAEAIRRRLVREGTMPPLPGDEETPAAPKKPTLGAVARLEARLAALEARVLALEQRAVDPFGE